MSISFYSQTSPFIRDIIFFDDLKPWGFNLVIKMSVSKDIVFMGNVLNETRFIIGCIGKSRE